MILGIVYNYIYKNYILLVNILTKNVQYDIIQSQKRK